MSGSMGPSVRGLAILIAALACARESPPADLDRHPLSADVVSVEVTGEPGAYTFAVGIASPDTGCGQYADWWEVVSATGELLHRRVLSHSHVDEQPFVRSSGPVAIDAERLVWIRAHMSPGGYGGVAWRGSVRRGFASAAPPEGFAEELAESPPLPDGCRF